MITFSVTARLSVSTTLLGKFFTIMLSAPMVTLWLMLTLQMYAFFAFLFY